MFCTSSLSLAVGNARGYMIGGCLLGVFMVREVIHGMSVGPGLGSEEI